MNRIMEDIKMFLFAYFYQLENEMNGNSKILKGIKFQSEEANTDEELKKFFKEYITKNNKIKSSISCNKLKVVTRNKEQEIDVKQLGNILIRTVYLPHELTPKMKADIAQMKDSVYTNPDLLLEIENGDKITYVSVELKSTKGDTIPGSSVQQVSPYEWVIFVKHSNTSVETSCGFYINSITERLPFPDRSPRPIIGHKAMEEWNEKNRTNSNGILKYFIDEELDEKKKLILINWEYALCAEWLETIHQEKKKSEKWFNNTIRLYTLELIKLIENDPEKMAELKTKLQRNIK